MTRLYRLLAALLVLAACDGQQPAEAPEPTAAAELTEVPAVAEATAASDDGCDDGLRLTEHAGGETCIPENPKRIAVLAERNVGETLVAMGIELIAVAYKEEYPFFVQDEFADFDSVIDLGFWDQPEYETTLAATPDLIIMVTNEYVDASVYENMSEIAPTVQIDPFTDVRQVNEDIGFIIDKEKIVELNALVDDAVERIANAVNDPGEIIVSSIFLRPEEFRITTANRQRIHTLLLQDAGFTLPENQRDLVPDQSPDLSLEDIERADADVLFLANVSAEDDNQREAMLNSPLWTSLDAVKNGNVIEGDYRYWSFAGPLSAQRVADEIAAGFEEIGLTISDEE